jgi:hypothetical protein
MPVSVVACSRNHAVARRLAFSQIHSSTRRAGIKAVRFACLARAPFDMRGEVLLLSSVTWFRSLSRLVQLEFTARSRMQVPLLELGGCAAWCGTRGLERCCHVGDALLLSVFGWLRASKPPSTLESFTAHPVRLFGFTSPSSRPPPPRCGHETTGRRRPRSRRRVIVSKTRPTRPRKPRVGRHSNSPSASAAACVSVGQVSLAPFGEPGKVAPWQRASGMPGPVHGSGTDLI